MKKVLITGADSYIGMSVENYITRHYPGEIEFDTLDMRDGAWREKDFSGYDAVFHVAGIAHDVGGKKHADLYMSVNRDLAVETAEKAKRDGAKQFLFMSSMLVYNGVGKKNITNDTKPKAKGVYARSKLQADEIVRMLADETFKVCVLRPPMIYGKGCKGNYVTLRKIALKLKIFPYVKNRRSMLYIENLCEFVYLMLTNVEGGVFFPQNAEYTNTSETVKAIAAAHGKKVRLIHGFGWAVRFSGLFVKLARKAFGNLTYDMSMSEYKEEYRKVDLMESVRLTEKE